MDEVSVSLRQVVLDCTDARRLAEFYRQLLGFRYRPGDAPPATRPGSRRGRPERAGLARPEER